MFKKIIEPTNTLFWIFVFLFTSALHFVITHLSVGLNLSTSLFQKSGDFADYVDSVERFLKGGKFIFSDNVNHSDKGYLYAYRTPGFAFIYYPLRLFFAYTVSIKLFLLLQVITNAIAKYTLCLLAFRLFKSKKMFWTTALLFCFSVYASYWNSFVRTESFALSFLIFSCYAFYKWQISQNKWHLFLAGLFLTEATFLRPFLAPLFLPFIILLINTSSLKQSLIFVLIYTISLVAIDGSWTIRNYYHTHEFIPLSKTLNWLNQKDKVFAIQVESCREIPLFSEDWMKSSPMYWFNNIKDQRHALDMYPKGFLPNDESVKLIESARVDYAKSKNDSLSLTQKQMFENSAYNKYKFLVHKYKIEHPNHHILSFFLISKDMLIQPLHRPFLKFFHPFGSLFNLASIAIESFVNRFIMIIGILSSFIGLYRYKKLNLVIAIIPLALFLFFTEVIRFIQYRFMYIPFVFMTIIAVENYFWLFKRNKLLSILIIMPVLLYLLYDISENVPFLKKYFMV